MAFARGYRLIEASLIMLFFVQAIRMVFGILLSMVDVALATRQITLLTLNSHLILAAALVLSWFAPRDRHLLPRTLLISAVLAIVARTVASIDAPFLRLAAGSAVIGFGGVYLASLLRANWRTWVNAIVIGFVFDQLLRAPDTYDISLLRAVRVASDSVGLAIPWVVPQIMIGIVVVTMSWLARKSARSEPYEPAYLDVWGGLALGGIFALQLLVLGMPGVIARWAGTAYAGMVPWTLLATALPLLPSVRSSLGQFLRLFDERLRGWILLLVISLALVLGNRLGSAIGAGAMIVAQLLTILLLWWIPSPHDPLEVEQIGPSTSLALIILTAAIYLYSLSFSDKASLVWLRGQSLAIIVMAAILSAFPRLWWREHDPWLENPAGSQALAAALIALTVVASIMLSSVGLNLPARSTAMSTLRVATYNINAGYDESGEYQLELIARTIEASQADIVVLQEVDTGRPVAFGVDQAEFLARRLQMHQVYQSGNEKLLGVAILSRWPIKDATRSTLPDQTNSTGAVRIHVSDDQTGHDVTIIGTQFSANSEPGKLRQLAVLLGLMGKSTPMIIGVDTRASPEDVAYQQLTASGMLDPDVALGIERGYTYPTSNPAIRRDYLFLRGLVPLASRQVDRSGSQHRLVVIEVGWP